MARTIAALIEYMFLLLANGRLDSLRLGI